MTKDGFNPYGSGPEQIGPRDVVSIADEAEAHLDRADGIIFFAQGCDKIGATEPFPVKPREAAE
jgi:hypothetical protein